MKYQNIIFEKIKSRVPDPKELIDRMTDVLNLSKSACYKRIRGESLLTLDELAILMKEFDLSYDELVFRGKEKIGFYFPYRNQEIKNFFDYVGPIKDFVIRAKDIPGLTVHYAINEFPFFFYFHDKDLTHFKFFTFAQTTWNISSYKSSKFSLEEFSEWPLIEPDIQLIQKGYYKIPNVEIWNSSVLSNTLNQIKYLLQAGFFKFPEEALVLCDKLDQVIHHLSKMAEVGQKFLIGQEPGSSSAKLEMYHNEIAHTNNILLLKAPEFNQIYFAYDNPNYIITDDANIIKYTIDWFETIKKSALPISQAADKNRRYFFSQIQKQIEHTRSQIKSIIRLEV